MEKVRVIAIGSSSFELANQIGEPLVGRKWQYYLYPLSQMELSETETRPETISRLEQRLIYGGYPEVILSNRLSDKKELLESVVENYLFKDIFILEEIRKSGKLVDILRLIAFQIGKEVSLSELANNLNINLRTIERYLDLLEKIFVIKRVNGFSRNLRKEITKTSRYYFYDNGVRNALINNFNDLNMRNDAGQLWENYLFTERMKRNHYKKIYSNIYFWRTYDKKEIDLIEEREGRLFGFEFKWGEKEVKAPKDWTDNYPNAKFEVVNRNNYLDFII